MDRFGKVYFGPKELDKQLEFLKAMNGAQLIELSKDQINEEYKWDMDHHTGCWNVVTLHNETEVKRFHNVMKTFFPLKEYWVHDKSDIPREPEEEEEFYERKNLS